jgi:hypothetical protein
MRRTPASSSCDDRPGRRAGLSVIRERRDPGSAVAGGCRGLPVVAGVPTLRRAHWSPAGVNRTFQIEPFLIRLNSGSFAKLTAMRRASSLVSRLFTGRRYGSSSK